MAIALKYTAIRTKTLRAVYVVLKTMELQDLLAIATFHRTSENRNSIAELMLRINLSAISKSE
jgi:hypothetical protein